MRWFSVGISPHLKMVRFTFILILLSLLKSGCLEKRVQWYKIASNIAVDRNMCAEHESTTDEISLEFCFQKCNEMEQCTGVAVENTQQSSWCCVFTANPIGVKSGSNVLIHKPEVQTRCLFGFDPETKCAQCLSSQRYDVLELVYVRDGAPHSGVVLNIILSGDLCTQISGNVQGYIDIVSGEIDRGNKTWTFEVANGTKFRATLLNGNMVNGTGYLPDFGAFTFTAIATN